MSAPTTDPSKTTKPEEKDAPAIDPAQLETVVLAQINTSKDNEFLRSSCLFYYDLAKKFETGAEKLQGENKELEEENKKITSEVDEFLERDRQGTGLPADFGKRFGRDALKAAISSIKQAPISNQAKTSKQQDKSTPASVMNTPPKSLQTTLKRSYEDTTPVIIGEDGNYVEADQFAQYKASRLSKLEKISTLKSSKGNHFKVPKEDENSPEAQKMVEELQQSTRDLELAKAQRLQKMQAMARGEVNVAQLLENSKSK